MQWTGRQYRCRHRACARRSFTERLSDLVAADGRHPYRVAPGLRAIGLALGGNTGVRRAARLRLPSRPSTRLRLVRGAPCPPAPALQVVGVDEWAWRRGHRDGTIRVDLVRHRVVDLSPDRSAARVAAWLSLPPPVTPVCRERRDLDADGMRRGAPPGGAGRRSRPSRAEPPAGLGRLPARSPRGTAGGRGWDGPGAHAVPSRGARHPDGSGPAPAPQARPTSRGRAAQTYLDPRCQIDADLARAQGWPHAFLALVRERRGEDRNAWRAEAINSGIEVLARCARGFHDALRALTAGLPLDGSPGPVEGQATRLKLLKRQGYGRAGAPRGRQRLRQAA